MPRNQQHEELYDHATRPSRDDERRVREQVPPGKGEEFCGDREERTRPDQDWPPNLYSHEDCRSLVRCPAFALPLPEEMSMAKKKMDLRQSGDSANMSQAIGWCCSQGLPVVRTSPHQLKIGPYNLYPNTGSWNSDLDPKKKPGGFPAFQAELARWWKQEQDPYRKSL